MKSEPNYIQYGLSITMGPKLREFVEEQLLSDLKHYPINQLLSESKWQYLFPMERLNEVLVV
jgi:hypothetical protein